MAIGLLAIIAAVASAADYNAADPADDSVTAGVDVTERGPAVSQGVEIADGYPKAIKRAQVVYSVNASDLDSAETLSFNAGLQISRCNPPDTSTTNANVNSPCEYLGRGPGNTYPYDPMIELRLYRAANSTQDSETAGTPILASDNASCTQAKHHCPLNVTLYPEDFAADATKPNFNVEVIAWTWAGNPNLSANDVVELEGDCKNGNYGAGPADDCKPKPFALTDTQSDDTRGQLGITREGALHPAGARTPTKEHANAMRDSRLTVNGHPAKVYVHPVHHLQPGDVIETSARMNVKDDRPQGYPFDHFVESWWIFTNSAGGGSDNLGVPEGAHGRYVSPRNGENCQRTGDGCVVIQRGTLTVPAGVASDSTWWVALRAHAKDSNATGTNFVNVLPIPVPTFEVTCYSVPRGPSDPPPCNT
ncbi:MAG: hypothetical protein AABM66_07105 [Actinomycetota bacterium]